VSGWSTYTRRFTGRPQEPPAGKAHRPYREIVARNEIGSRPRWPEPAGVRPRIAALTKPGRGHGVARDGGQLAEVRAELGESFPPVTGDAADPALAGQLIDAYRPDLLVLNAGATPLLRPIQRHTWETFGRTWDVDVRHAFGWVREALLTRWPRQP
jgi:NAD(P)-dependent dehydrogenase (short-subunit alcohol dehydrogenase family)